VDEVGVAEVVEASALEDLRASLEPDSLTKLGAVLGQDLGGDAAEGAKHGPPGVDHLSLAVRLEGLGVSGETSSVLQRASPITLLGGKIKITNCYAEPNRSGFKRTVNLVRCLVDRGNEECDDGIGSHARFQTVSFQV
jgi:hypothetical protein